jgi:hypothetical protein
MGLAVSLLLLGTCPGGQELPVKNDGDSVNGTVSVKIPIQSSRSLDDLTTDEREYWIDYYEAVFRERGSGTYYTGKAYRNEAYLTVNVTAGKVYDVLLLAGTSENHTPEDTKILLASGFAPNQPINSGLNIIEVSMKVHKTTSAGLTDLSDKYTYNPVITDVQALISGAAVLPASTLIHPEDAVVWLISSTDPSVRTSTPVPLLLGINTLTINADIVYADIGGLFTPCRDVMCRPSMGTSCPCPSCYNQVSNTSNCQCSPGAVISSTDVLYYYDLTYYGFSDPASGSSPWSIRRGITHDITDPTTNPNGGAQLLERNGSRW